MSKPIIRAGMSIGLFSLILIFFKLKKTKNIKKKFWDVGNRIRAFGDIYTDNPVKIRNIQDRMVI